MDTLVYYVENRMSKFFTNDTEIVEIVYGETPGTAMLQFAEEIKGSIKLHNLLARKKLFSPM